MEQLPDGWKNFLDGYTDWEKLSSTLQKVEERRLSGEVYPPPGSVFKAFALTSPGEVRAVIIGQDPYHEPGQAQGLAFSVPAGVKHPPSLRNIFKEYASDTGEAIPVSGDLTSWARSGVLLMNAVLTVDAGKAASHAKKAGWEDFSDSVIKALSARKSGIVFILWGNFAASKRPLIDENRHLCLVSAHPSPLSARRGFFGSRPFSRAAAFAQINWKLEL